MSLPPPSGFAICSATFAKTGQPHVMVTTLAVKCPAVSNANNTNTNWRTAILGTSARPWFPANMIVGYSIVETYVLERSAAGVLTSNTNITPVVGTRAAVPMPPNTSVVVTKVVAPVGRQYRGRMLWPPTSAASSAIDGDGIIGATPLATLGAYAAQVFNTLTAANFLPYMLHQPPQGGGATPAPTPISGLTVNARIGTIRHRIRH